jgi:hypothetical protein
VCKLFQGVINTTKKMVHDRLEEEGTILKNEPILDSARTSSLCKLAVPSSLEQQLLYSKVTSWNSSTGFCRSIGEKNMHPS